MFKLVIQDDEGKTTVVPLIRDEITIGRKEGNTIRLTERNVSRRHARILRNNGEVHIEDLGSYNGIRVNNARIAERVSLRVSDQVQIGDYKLYLKAEGAEQVDDARTMPIERVDANGEATTAPSSTQTPTQPLGVPSQPGLAANGTPATGTANGGLAGAQLVGNPNRTLVAIADTDPAGRPVATAAAVAALTAPVGYGKLVVLSSNFAGKEFELSRPQMIIGRTDENDIVINHRSISRNHAKLVRETETGRYTVSDLQSSNGVRVNGQDYSKVELRRGDVVDLGHVRLRFIEPGEDFLFSRDAVITDVPEAGGSKKGLLVAIVLGIVVLGAVGVFFMMSKDNGSKARTNPVENPIVTIDAGGSGADLGSDAGDTAIAVNPIDAPPTVELTADDQAIAACQALKDAGKWHELTDCTANIKDPKKKKELFDIGTVEAHAEQSDLKIDDFLKDGNIKSAERERDKIAETSRYRRQNNDKIDNAKSDANEKLKTAVGAAVANKECGKVPRLINDAKAKGVPTDGISTACTPATTAVNTQVKPTEVKPTEVKPTEVKPAEPCDAATSKAKGDDYVTNGMDTAALAQFELSLRCKSDPQVMRLAFMSACKAKNTAAAKKWWQRVSTLPSTNANQYKQICVRYGITIE